VAEQEGQQTETEATGAPQKHHYTLNQQVGSITVILCEIYRIYLPFFGAACPQKGHPRHAHAQRLAE
ncbi:hypothetical protein, partial [Klebsiella pneumoniae]